MPAEELKPIGDRELFYVENTKEDWSIPIFCDPYSSDGENHTHYVVRPALSLMMNAYTAVHKVFAGIDLGENRNSWIIEVGAMPDSVKKAKGITPEYYFKFNSEAGKPDEELLGYEEVEITDVTSPDFLEYACKMTGLDMKVMKVFWLSWQKAAVSWLLNKNKPIELTFMKITPVPFRANWKEIMLGKKPSAHKAFRLPKEQKFGALLGCGFIEELASTDNVQINPYKRHFYWNLDCQTNRYWDTLSEEAEKIRLGIKGHRKYVGYYESCIRNCMPHIIETYDTWVKKIAAPYARVGESAVDGSLIFVPIPKSRSVLFKWNKKTFINDKLSHNTVKIKQGGKGRRLEKEAADMLRLPDIRSLHKDLWGFDDSGYCEGEWETGEDGVRLLHAPESEDV